MIGIGIIGIVSHHPEVLTLPHGPSCVLHSGLNRSLANCQESEVPAIHRFPKDVEHRSGERMELQCRGGIET